jgi:hypothetical protein
MRLKFIAGIDLDIKTKSDHLIVKYIIWSFTFQGSEILEFK